MGMQAAVNVPGPEMWVLPFYPGTFFLKLGKMKSVAFRPDGLHVEKPSLSQLGAQLCTESDCAPA